MSRTVELGRAVLSSQSSSLQLWLTTSITISPQDELTNLPQLNQSQVLEYLLSGNCWVCRANGLHLALEFTVQGEPLDREEKERLAVSIVNAPVWSQLHLRASIPENNIGDAHQETGGKDIRVNIDHLRTAEQPSKPQPHRIGLNVPAADVGPPAGVSVMGLQSVKLHMAFLRNKAKSNAKKQKVDNGNASSEVNPSQTLRDADFAESPPGCRHGDGKEVTLQSTMQASEILAELLATRGEKRKEPPKGTLKADTGSGTGSPEEICEISKYVDGALRLSVCKGVVKLPQGIKLVTNTFMGTLSEVCPAVWRLQYLPALSERAHLLPTISRSFGRAWPKVKSLSLRSKLDCLAVTDIEGLFLLREPRAADTHTITSIHTGLWCHVQKRLAEKPIKAYEPFCSHIPSFSTTVGTDDILDQGSTAPEPTILDASGDDDLAVMDTEPIGTGHETQRISSILRGPLLNDQVLHDPMTATGAQKAHGDDLFIDNTCEEEYSGPARKDLEIEISHHTSDPAMTLEPVDVVEHSGTHPMGYPLDPYNDFEPSEDTLFDEPPEEAGGLSKGQLLPGAIDEADNASTIADFISVF